ncbi:MULTISPECIES: IS200/IS605 family accessory protein TnpB-related protein [Moorena]|uniref:Transposase, IS605 OrfB family, central region n=3 Tax=Moorena TaxID=1155738 RepID=F4XL75_9CYAN|nr:MULTISPECIES: IS200/IS605 family accessory protein TnpB-related protein [Moorena]EGJ34599.1 transposase, IS605 OrfB family, central region [Moorena producens 3L]NEP69084.1 IS200/IS605 family element transposase accessory protein TnpB [Moorena sp. SIO3A5]NER90977.1 IS200/IS605 family element transposase accessory protein TnpB [Moorena sp. SIO3A2]OLT67071.1 transposase [Moorena producens 3L]
MYRTIPVKGTFTDEENAFWVFQCEQANSLINCAIYYAKQKHYSWLREQPEGYTTYWRDDVLKFGWKTYRCAVKYPELDKALKMSPHYKAMAAQSAQQTLKSVGESMTSYNQLVRQYYKGEVDRPRLPRYRQKGGLAAVTFPKQALTYKKGLFYPSVSKESKPELLCEITLEPPEFIDPDWVKEVTIRPYLGQLWLDWVIDDGRQSYEHNPNLDYSQAWSFDHGGDNWLTGVSTQGKSLIIDGRKLKSMNQGYARLVAKYKTGKPEFFWDANLDRVQRKRNNQMRDAINKAARFIINRCLNDRVGNIIFGWNERQKDSINIGRRSNQIFVAIPTKRLIERLKQLCPEYGIKLTITEESYTSKASYLDEDPLPKHGEKPKGWKPSGKRVRRGLYETAKGYLINADTNGAANIARKVATQLGLDLAKVGSGSLTLPHRYDLFNSLKKSYRTRSEAARVHPAASQPCRIPRASAGGDVKEKAMLNFYPLLTKNLK